MPDGHLRVVEATRLLLTMSWLTLVPALIIFLLYRHQYDTVLTSTGEQSMEAFCIRESAPVHLSRRLSVRTRQLQHIPPPAPPSVADA